MNLECHHVLDMACRIKDLEPCEEMGAFCESAYDADRPLKAAVPRWGYG